MACKRSAVRSRLAPFFSHPSNGSNARNSFIPPAVFILVSVFIFIFALVLVLVLASAFVLAKQS